MAYRMSENLTKTHLDKESRIYKQTVGSLLVKILEESL